MSCERPFETPALRQRSLLPYAPAALRTERERVSNNCMCLSHHDIYYKMEDVQRTYFTISVALRLFGAE